MNLPQYFDPGSQSPPSTNQNSPFRSCQSLNEPESPLFHSPESSSEEDSTLLREDDVLENSAPLITQENHHGTERPIGRSMSLVFSDSSSSIKTAGIPLWRRVRQVKRGALFVQ